MKEGGKRMEREKERVREMEKVKAGVMDRVKDASMCQVMA